MKIFFVANSSQEGQNYLTMTQPAHLHLAATTVTSSKLAGNLTRCSSNSVRGKTIYTDY